MLSFETAWEQQKDLDALCANRWLDTAEYFIANDCYGNATVLKDYAGIMQAQLLNVIIPHGIHTGTQIWAASEQHPIQNVYCWQPQQVKNWTGKSKIVRTGAAPLVYAAKNIRKVYGKNNSERSGTIFFPAHSTAHVEARQDYAEIIATLKNLPKKYQPVTVCLYWKDYQNGHAAIFEQAGFEVVSAGHMYDRDFLYRFVHLVERFSHSASNSPGSALIYSQYLGCNAFYLPLEVERITDGKDDAGYVAEQKSNPIADELRAKFSGRKEDGAKTELARQWLQADLVTSPADLQAVLLA